MALALADPILAVRDGGFDGFRQAPGLLVHTPQHWRRGQLIGGARLHSGSVLHYIRECEAPILAAESNLGLMRSSGIGGVAHCGGLEVEPSWGDLTPWLVCRLSS